MGTRERKGGETAEGMTAVEHEVVPGERPRALCRVGGFRKNGLLQSAGRAAVASHTVKHSDKRRRNQPPEVRGCGGGEIAESGQQRNADQGSSSSESIR